MKEKKSTPQQQLRQLDFKCFEKGEGMNKYMNQWKKYQTNVSGQKAIDKDVNDFVRFYADLFCSIFREREGKQGYVKNDHDENAHINNGRRKLLHKSTERVLHEQ